VNASSSRSFRAEAALSTCDLNLKLQQMSNHSTELTLRTENARLRQLVLKKDTMLLKQQLAALTERPPTYDRYTQESIILDLVIPHFVGASEYCFMAGVSRGRSAQQLNLSFAEATKKQRTKHKLRTSHRAALTAAARPSHTALFNPLSDAHCNLKALQLINLVQKVAVDASAQADVLASLRELGCTWDEDICAEAAGAGALRTLIWAQEQNCAWCDERSCIYAAQEGRTHVLQWLRSNCEYSWDYTDEARLLFTAGFCSDLTAAKWLRAIGADWPMSFYEFQSDVFDGEPHPWSVATAQWALDSGCSWGEWCCLRLEPQPYHSGATKDERLTRELFDWAHLNGCPCRCDDWSSDNDDYNSGSEESGW
jgi:hypothetical protein